MTPQAVELKFDFDIVYLSAVINDKHSIALD